MPSPPDRLHTPEVQRRRREARAALIASTPATTRPGSETTTLVVGDRVRVERAEPAKGTWARYVGREGTVVSINRQTFPHGRGTYVELGVSFTLSPAASSTRVTKADAEVWFRADELRRCSGDSSGRDGRRPSGGSTGRAPPDAASPGPANPGDSSNNLDAESKRTQSSAGVSGPAGIEPE